MVRPSPEGRGQYNSCEIGDLARVVSGLEILFKLIKLYKSRLQQSW